MWVPLCHRGLVLSWLVSARRSLLVAKNKMLNPSKTLPPISLHLLSCLNRETVRDFIYPISSGATRLNPTNVREATDRIWKRKSFTSRWRAEETSFQGLFIKVGFWSKNSKYVVMAVMPWICKPKPKRMQEFLLKTSCGCLWLETQHFEAHLQALWLHTFISQT